MKTYSKANAKKDLPTRTTHDNKTRGGRCLIVAGSRGMWGAAILTANAAARTGAGYVYLSPTSSGFPTTKNPNFLLNTKKDLKNFDVIAIGPGAKNSSVGSWIKKALKSPNVVLDAEALNYLAKNKITIPETWIVTPHEGELSRLLKVPSADIQNNREYFVRLAQRKLGCVVLLKGNKTLVATQDHIYKIQSGNPALAKAGTGDVLTGIISALLSQGLEAPKAACLGAYIHGFIADEWLKKNDILSLLATDLIQELPQTLKKIRN